MGERKKGAVRVGFDREAMIPRLWGWLKATNVVKWEI